MLIDERIEQNLENESPEENLCILGLSKVQSALG